MRSYKRPKKNCKKAVDIGRCQGEQPINFACVLAEYSVSLWIRAGEWLLPSSCFQTCSKSLLDIPIMKCLSLLFVFHFPIACFLSRMSHALLSRISSAKLHALCLSVPAHCDKCWCIAFCGVAILMQADLRAHFNPLPLRRDSSPQWCQLYPETCQC